jgi:hypothetical protein
MDLCIVNYQVIKHNIAISTLSYKHRSWTESRKFSVSFLSLTFAIIPLLFYFKFIHKSQLTQPNNQL